MFLRLTTSTLALAVSAAPLFALTPEEVWATWSSYYARSGYVVAEGSRDLAGEVLTLKDVTLTQTMEGADTVVLSMPEVVMTGTGDGGVRTTIGQGMGLEVRTTDGEEKPVVVKGQLDFTGAEILSTGTAADQTDTLTAPTMTATLDLVDLPEGDDLTDVATATLVNVVSEMRYAGTRVSSDSKVDQVVFELAMQDGEEGKIEASGTMAGIEATSEANQPEGVAMDFGPQMSDALRAGAALAATIKFGPVNATAAFAGKAEDGSDESGEMVFGSGGTEVTFRVDEGGLAYQGATTALDTRITSVDMPFLIAYRMADASFDMQVPVLAQTAAQPWKIAYAIGGLTMDEGIWALFDPAQTLPRDPAEIDIDLTGQVVMKGDLFTLAAEAAAEAGDDAPEVDPAGVPTIDPAATPAEGTDPVATPAEGDAAATEAAEAPVDPMPFDVTEMVINRIALAAAGAKGEASGQLKMAPGNDIETATGTIEARLEGVNGLIDKLVAMGLISQDEVMGYRMMLTMFTKAGEGEDVLTSVVEMKDGGEVLVNGQKIK